MDMWIYIFGIVYSEYNNGNFGAMVISNAHLHNNMGVVIILQLEE